MGHDGDSLKLNWFRHMFIHFVVCLTKHRSTFPMQVLLRGRIGAYVQFPVSQLFLKMMMMMMMMMMRRRRQQQLTFSFESCRHFYLSLYLSINKVFYIAVRIQEMANKFTFEHTNALDQSHKKGAHLN
jgi:hypothetical protein